MTPYRTPGEIPPPPPPSWEERDRARGVAEDIAEQQPITVVDVAIAMIASAAVLGLLILLAWAVVR